MTNHRTITGYVHAVRHTRNESGNLAKDPHEDQPESASEPSTTGSALSNKSEIPKRPRHDNTHLGKRNDSIVLRKGGVGHGRKESGQDGADGVGREPP